MNLKFKIQSSFLSFTELFQYMQKQLAPVAASHGGSGGSAANRGDGQRAAGRDGGGASGDNKFAT